MTFYSKVTSTAKEILHDNRNYINGLSKQITTVSAQLEQYERSSKTQECPFCKGIMIDVSFLKTLTIKTPTWYSSPFRPEHYYHNDAIPNKWECQDCGIFDYEPFGKTQYHWTRQELPNSGTALASLVFAAITEVEEIIYANSSYHKLFFLLVGQDWYTFGCDITKDEILERLGLGLDKAPRTNGNKEGFVYILQGEDYYKIGKTINLDQRIGQISPRLPFPVTLIHTIETNDIHRLEVALHQRFAPKRTNGEWFELDKDDLEWLSSFNELTYQPA